MLSLCWLKTSAGFSLKFISGWFKVHFGLVQGFFKVYLGLVKVSLALVKGFCRVGFGSV